MLLMLFSQTAGMGDNFRALFIKCSTWVRIELFFLKNSRIFVCNQKPREEEENDPLQ